MQNKICPLLLACPADIPPECRGDRCTWWDCLDCACSLVSLVDILLDISTSLEDLSAGKEDEDHG